MAEKHSKVTMICRQMYAPANPEIADLYFKMASGILPTRARLHALSPARWDTPLCNWCGINADTAHVFTKCQKVVPVWTWMRSKVHQLAVNLTRIEDSELLALEFPTTVKEVEVGYLVMSTMKHWWDHIKQYRILTVEKLQAMLKQDLKKREEMKLPKLSRDLYRIIVT